MLDLFMIYLNKTFQTCSSFTSSAIAFKPDLSLHSKQHPVIVLHYVEKKITEFAYFRWYYI
jgi:hypothetical protein